MSNNRLILAVQSKFHETVERTQHLISLIPVEQLHWHPGDTKQNYNDIGHLLSHLICCMQGFCAVMHRAFPAELKHFADLRSMKEADHFCQPQEAAEQIRFLAACVDEGFRQCTDADLGRMLPTLFVPEGEPI